jgi:hypothetical protein
MNSQTTNTALIVIGVVLAMLLGGGFVFLYASDFTNPAGHETGT